jgi:hypothetical protein
MLSGCPLRPCGVAFGMALANPFTWTSFIRRQEPIDWHGMGNRAPGSAFRCSLGGAGRGSRPDRRRTCCRHSGRSARPGSRAATGPSRRLMAARRALRWGGSSRGQSHRGGRGRRVCCRPRRYKGSSCADCVYDFNRRWGAGRNGPGPGPCRWEGHRPGQGRGSGPASPLSREQGIVEMHCKAEPVGAHRPPRVEQGN